MALHVLPILKALAPLVVNASGIASGIQAIRSGGRVEERIQHLETETVRIGEVVPDLVRQMQALAEQLRAQEAVNAKLQARVRWALGVAVLSGVIAATALVSAIV